MITIVGDADHSVGPELEDVVRRALRSGGAYILLDLKRCPYLDSGGLNVIVHMVYDVSPTGWVGIIHCSRMIQRLLELVGLNACSGLRIFESLEEARQAAASI